MTNRMEIGKTYSSNASDGKNEAVCIAYDGNYCVVKPTKGSYDFLHNSPYRKVTGIVGIYNGSWTEIVERKEPVIKHRFTCLNHWKLGSSWYSTPTKQCNLRVTFKDDEIIGVAIYKQ